MDNKKIFSIYYIVIGLLFIFWLTSLSLDKFTPLIHSNKISISLLFFSICFILVIHTMRILRINSIFNFYDENVSFVHLVPIYFCSIFFSNTTPLKLGEASKPILYNKLLKIKSGKAIATTAIERILDLSIILCALIIFSMKERAVYYSIGISFLVSFFILGMIFPINPKFIGKILPKNMQILNNNYSSYYESTIGKSRFIRLSFGMIFIIQSIFILFLELGFIYFVIIFMGLKTNFIFTSYAFIISFFGGIISYTPAGAITTEMVFAGLFAVNNLSKELAIISIIFARICGIYLSTLIGFYYVTKLKIRNVI